MHGGVGGGGGFGGHHGGGFGGHGVGHGGFGHHGAGHGGFGDGLGGPHPHDRAAADASHSGQPAPGRLALVVRWIFIAAVIAITLFLLLTSHR